MSEPQLDGRYMQRQEQHLCSPILSSDSGGKQRKQFSISHTSIFGHQLRATAMLPHIPHCKCYLSLLVSVSVTTPHFPGWTQEN